jgi:hypothetical protein
MSTQFSFSDIEAGKSYACRFLIREGLATTEKFGIIKTRDSEHELVEIIEVDSEETYVVKWDDCWDLDEVEWRD